MGYCPLDVATINTVGSHEEERWLRESASDVHVHARFTSYQQAAARSTLADLGLPTKDVTVVLDHLAEPDRELIVLTRDDMQTMAAASTAAHALGDAVPPRSDAGSNSADVGARADEALGAAVDLAMNICGEASPAAPATPRAPETPPAAPATPLAPVGATANEELDAGVDLIADLFGEASCRAPTPPPAPEAPTAAPVTSQAPLSDESKASERPKEPDTTADLIADLLRSLRREDGDDTEDGKSTSEESEKADVMSDISDTHGDLYIGVEEHKVWETPEDASMACIEALAEHLRARPSLPPHPTDPQESWPEAESGMAFPVCHCDFKGCSWVSDDPACGLRSSHRPLWIAEDGDWTLRATRCQSSEGVYGCCRSKSCLREHIVEWHVGILRDTIGFERLSRDSYDYYLEAIACREREQMSNT